jgi:hypothetical protein
VPAAIDRVQKCQIYLNTCDKGGFVLEKIPVTFARTVDDDSIVIGLGANDSSQTDLKDYQSFLLGDRDTSWDIGWTCPSAD